MRTETMTVTHALTQLKILDARITTAIEEGTYITAIQPKSYAKSVETLTAEITGSMQRVNAMIARYNAIKMAIVMSNASTKVTIGAKTYTVAGFTTDASMLGAEYALTIHANNTCELSMAGFPVLLKWTQEADRLVIDYMGAATYYVTLTDAGIDLDMNGMVLNMVAQ